MKGLAATTVFLVAAALLAGNVEAAEQEYRMTFRGSLDSGFGGLPPTTISGWLEFRNLPPQDPAGGIWDNYLVDYGEVTLESQGTATFSSDNGYIKVENDAILTTRVRDEYHATLMLDGTWSESFDLTAGGIRANQYVYPPALPTAFDSTDLPTSAAALGGFDNLQVWLSFRNLSAGGGYSSSAPIQEFSLVAVPEPSTLVLLCGGVVGLLVHARRKRRQVE